MEWKLEENTEEREDALVLLIEEADKLYEAKDLRGLGHLQYKIDSIRPRGEDSNLVLQICSRNRKDLKREQNNT